MLDAMNIDHALERGVFGWRLLVAEHEANFAREQWRLYQLENRPKHLRHNAIEPRPGAGLGALGWAATLLIFYALQSEFAFGIDWTATGRLAAGAVRAGEWWRPITALTLHIDIAHLLVNVGFGAIFGSLLAREIGAGNAWGLILAGGGLGNVMNALVQRPTHISIGASTAVFAALGLLGAYLWTARRMLTHSWATRLSPVVGAVILLTWLGTGDERTDIVAHLTGFIAGFVPGAMLGRLPWRPGGTVSRQWLGGGLALLVVVGAWMIALGN